MISSICKCHIVSGYPRVVGSGPRGRRFKSYRPDKEIKGLRDCPATLFRFTHKSPHKTGSVGHAVRTGFFAFGVQPIQPLGDGPGQALVDVTATIGNQVADIKFNIPPVITPPFFYAAPLETITWTTNINLPTWSSVPPGINSLTGLWIAPSIVGQTVKITATDFGSNNVTRDVLILDKFPFSDFSLPVSWDRNLSALVSMSEDRTSRITREKAPAYDTYPITLTSRTLADSNAVDAFFDAKGLGKPFILEDKIRGIRKVGWFDSAIRHEARDECDIDLSFQFLEARI